MEPATNLTIRALTQIDDLKLCEEVQRSVWGFSDLEVMAASHLSAAVHASGLVAGAFCRESPHAREIQKPSLCGFVFGFPAYENSSVGLHSHMMAVLSEYRGLGIGQRLKWFQRDWCLRQGLKWVTWTFDPLQAKNAKLNLEHLGAAASEYLINPYGALGGTLNGELPSDRLVVRWDLTSSRVRGLESQISLEVQSIPYALDANTLTPNLMAEPRLLVATPEDINALRKEQPDKALAWRLAQREVFSDLFSEGYSVTRFVGGCYVLERSKR